MIVVWCMEMRVDKNRIKFGLHLAGWSYEEGDPQVLLDQGRKVLPSEFESRMLGDIFCPVCKTSLTRSPKEKANYVNGRSACFKHLPSYSQVDCPLRVPRAEGKRYETEESAAQAIAHELLAVVSGFMKERPQPVDDQADPYDQSAVEDLEGPHSMVPIARYRGESFKLPSRITTVAGICRGFDKNYYKYYVMPGTGSARLLSSMLLSVEQVAEVSEKAGFYWGRIVSSRNAGTAPKPTNTRMTQLQSGRAIHDFYLKAPAWEQEEKGIDDDSVGRIVLFWGLVTKSGIGLCIDRPGWGEYALLPKKYEYLFDG